MYFHHVGQKLKRLISIVYIEIKNSYQLRILCTSLIAKIPVPSFMLRQIGHHNRNYISDQFQATFIVIQQPLRSINRQL